MRAKPLWSHPAYRRVECEKHTLETERTAAFVTPPSDDTSPAQKNPSGKAPELPTTGYGLPDYAGDNRRNAAVGIIVAVIFVAVIAGTIFL